VDYDPASVIDHYIGMLELDLRSTRDQLSGSFFKSAHGKNGKFFRNVPMGKNLLEKIGHEFAEELVLPEPHTFTGHCWRRSCGTNASDAGVNVTTLMAHCGWNTPKTAIGYVKKSRMTSFNMAMFLSNVQRQNQDLDTILTKTKPLIGGSKGSRGGATCTKKVKSFSGQQKIVAGSGLQNLEGVRNAVVIPAAVPSIVESSVSPETLASEEKIETDKLSVQNGGGGADPLSGGGGGIGDDQISGQTESRVGSVTIDNMSVLSDPRVSSILSNLSNHGQLHVHFHFGGK
jgi:hypothetical protein